MDRVTAFQHRGQHRKARKKILKAVNKHRPKDRQLYLRHINRAVRIARVWKLVPNKLLIEAGFNPVKEQGT